jgi:hypothetical protein
MEALLTFKNYLAGRKAGADAAGDFVRLARSDPTFPDVTTLDDVLSYLTSRGRPEWREGAEFIWTKYRQAVRDADRRTARKDAHRA